MMNRLARAAKSSVRAFKRSYGGYDVAGGSGRWPSQYALHGPITQQLAASRLASRKIAWLSENSALVASIIQTAVTAIVADGPTVRPLHPDPIINRYLQNAWNEFYQDCDIEGTHSLGGFLSRIARGFYVDGEAFVQLVVDPNAMRLRLRYVTAEQVDSSKTIPSLGMTGDGPFIIAGVEFGTLGRVVAFWIFPAPPDAPWASVSPAIRVESMDICHIFEPRFAGVPRGISPLTAIAPLALELDEAHDAAIVKLKTTALLAMILRDPNGDAFDIDQRTEPASLELYPGGTLRLPSGADVSFPPVAEMTSLAEVLKHMSRLVCAGGGAPYFMAANDWAEINYSAGKLGLAAFQRRIRAIQQNHIVGQLLNPIWRRFVILEVLSGRMRAPDYETNPENYAANFLFPGWPALDELKKAKADTLAINAGLRSRQEIIAEGGRDPSDVDAEIEADPLAPDLGASAANISNQPELETSNA